MAIPGISLRNTRVLSTPLHEMEIPASFQERNDWKNIKIIACIIATRNAYKIQYLMFKTRKMKKKSFFTTLTVRRQ